MNVWQYIKNYKQKSVFFKYLKLIIAVIMIFMIFINVSVYYYYRGVVKNNVVSYNTQTVHRMRSSIDVITNECSKFYSTLSLNKYMKIFATSSVYDLFNDDNTILFTELSNLLSGFINTNDCISSIYLYSNSSRYVFSLNSSNYIDKFYDTEWYDKYLQRQSGFSYFRDTREPCVTVCTELYINNSKDGLVVINFDVSKIDKMLVLPHTPSGTTHIIANENGNILYSNEKKYMGSNISSYSSLNDVYNKCGDNTEEITASFDKICVSAVSSRYSNWKYIVSTPLDIFYQQLAGLRRILILILAVTMIFSLMLAFLLALSMYNSIADILSVIQTSQAGSENMNSPNEISYIYNNLTSVINSKKQIETELIKKLEALRKAQSIALQTQINPHFLFNTLQLANLLITSNENTDDASKIILLMSDLLRISLDDTDTLVPLALEIEHAKKYLNIQSYKFKNLFDVKWDLDESAFDYKTIKLVLQPLIENAIEHGIKPTNLQCSIVISAKVQNNMLVLNVTDDGAGMTQAQLKKVVNGINSDSITESHHIGLSNVNKRIKLIFGDNYGCSIDSEFGEYTSVTLTFPLCRIK